MKPIHLFRLFIAVCFSITIFTSAKAQYVAIPDSNFGNWLHNNGFSSCLTGGAAIGYNLDTNCSVSLSHTSVNLSNAGIRDISGIEYFTYLYNIDCSHNFLTFISKLPPLTGALYCNSNNLTSLPSLPQTIAYINCANNQLTSLPALPTGLVSLVCDTNRLTTLPSLSSGLTILSCDSNRLTNLPALPPAISDISVRHNSSLQCLPHIYPRRLSSFYISGSGINCLPDSFGATSYDVNPSTMAICTGSCLSANRYLAIPDTNFGNWLNSNGYASCLTGSGASGWYQLDTTCSTVLHADTMRCQNSNIHSISGVQYFKNLKYLDCSLNNLDSLVPNLPSSLSYLSIGQNSYISRLPILPAGLTYFDCNNSGALLSALPVSLKYLDCSHTPNGILPTLPTSLMYLDCSYDGNPYTIATLPTLPATLKTLKCSNNSLTSLPALPTGLIYLDCSGNYNLNGGFLSVLPQLPATLAYLNCSSNILTSLPALPASLKYLDCSLNNFPNVNNGLQILPTLPAGLLYLNCVNDPINVLPALPASLTYLNCSAILQNFVPTLPGGLRTLSCETMGYYPYTMSSLPPLPASLDSLYCGGNPSLTCLPHIYQNPMHALFIHGTAITCMPNRFSALAYDIRPDSLPVCTPASHCFSYSIAGNVHNDTSSSCLSDSLHPGGLMPHIKILLKQSGQVVQQVYTDAALGYSFSLNSLPGYSVDIDTSYLPFMVECPSASPVALTAADTLGVPVNFGLRCSNPDYGIDVIVGGAFEPGDTTAINVVAGNPLLYWYNAICGAGVPGTVTTIINGPVHYAGPEVGALIPSQISGDTLIYNINDLDSLTLGSLYILVYTDTTASIGTSVCLTGIIRPAIPDLYPGDDTSTLCMAVVSAFDPNHKEVTPTNISENGGWLTYTVGFQNTGTTTATTVVVRDTLSQSVLPQTFQFLASSHKANVTVADHAVAFTFSNINLVDSATDRTLSKGWLQYKVKAAPSLPVQTQIQNTAYIYFDYNAPVATNMAVSTVTPNTNNGIVLLSNGQVRLYPNPNNGSFTLLTPEDVHSSYTITDMMGNMIAKQSITAKSQLINLPVIADGVYTLRVEGSEPMRFVILK
jgi:uncharacterized repeat protein (TIGR01451 family)